MARLLQTEFDCRYSLAALGDRVYTISSDGQLLLCLDPATEQQTIISLGAAAPELMPSRIKLVGCEENLFVCLQFFDDSGCIVKYDLVSQTFQTIYRGNPCTFSTAAELDGNLYLVSATGVWELNTTTKVTCFFAADLGWCREAFTCDGKLYMFKDTLTSAKNILEVYQLDTSGDCLRLFWRTLHEGWVGAANLPGRIFACFSWNNSTVIHELQQGDGAGLASFREVANFPGELADAVVAVGESLVLSFKSKLLVYSPITLATEQDANWHLRLAASGKLVVSRPPWCPSFATSVLILDLAATFGIPRSAVDDHAPQGTPEPGQTSGALMSGLDTAREAAAEDAAKARDAAEGTTKVISEARAEVKAVAETMLSAGVTLEVDALMGPVTAAEVIEKVDTEEHELQQAASAATAAVQRVAAAAAAGISKANLEKHEAQQMAAAAAAAAAETAAAAAATTQSLEKANMEKRELQLWADGLEKACTEEREKTRSAEKMKREMEKAAAASQQAAAKAAASLEKADMEKHGALQAATVAAAASRRANMEKHEAEESVAKANLEKQELQKAAAAAAAAAAVAAASLEKANMEKHEAQEAAKQANLEKQEALEAAKEANLEKQELQKAAAAAAAVAAASLEKANMEKHEAQEAAKEANLEKQELQKAAARAAAVAAASLEKASMEKHKAEEAAAAAAAAADVAAAEQAEEIWRLHKSAAWKLLSHLELAKGQVRPRLQLPLSDPRYVMICKLIGESCRAHRRALGDQAFCPPPNLLLLGVDLLHNRDLAKQYSLTRKQIQQRRSAANCTRVPVFEHLLLPSFTGCQENPLNEVLLFHGAPPDTVEKICCEGFDPRRGGEASGAMFGLGTYFAANASKADIYTERRTNKLPRGAERKLIVARVLMGEAYRATSSIRDACRPPDDPVGSPYDSVWADIREQGGAVDHLEVVVFDKGQAVPVLVVTYRHSDTCECAECSKRPA